MSEEHQVPMTVRERIDWALEQERQRSRGGSPSCIILGCDTYLALCREMERRRVGSGVKALRKYRDRPVYVVALSEALQLGYSNWHYADLALREEERVGG